MDDHKRMMADLEAHFKPVLDHSVDGVYLWLDEKHMICNEKFAKMLGYTVADMRRAGLSLEQFVAEKDQEMFSKQYHSHIAKLSRPVTFRFHALKKDGKTFLAETDMIPLTYNNHAIAYHFVRVAKA